MARPKIIEDSVLLDLIKKYFQDECNNDVKKLKTSEIVMYVNNHGYPKFTAYTLRRAAPAMEYIEELKRNISDDTYVTVVSYQTIDAAALVDANRSRESLIKAISARDCYYKTIADSASQSFERYNKLKKQYDEEKEKNACLAGRIAELEELVQTNKAEIKALKAELKANEAVIDTYIYPEIANELLIKEGAVRKTKGVMKEDAIEGNVITSKTDIKKTAKSGSNVITGLFDIFED